MFFFLSALFSHFFLSLSLLSAKILQVGGESRTRSVQKFKIKMKLCICIKMGGLQWELKLYKDDLYRKKVCYCMKIDVCCGFGVTNPF